MANVDSPLSQRIPIARLELGSKIQKAITDELDADSKVLLVEFAWADLDPQPPTGHKTTYTLEWDEKPIVLPLLEEQSWEWDAPIEVPSEVIYDGNATATGQPGEEETVMMIMLIPPSVPHISKVHLRQKRDAIAPPVAANTELEDVRISALELPVKTLPPTYPLSSEFLGANYRYIADLILREVSTAPAEKTSRGILHTLFAVRRLEEVALTDKSKKHVKEERNWIEKELGVDLERLEKCAPQKQAEIVGSPGATAKEWAPQSVLATTKAESVDDPPVPWTSTPNSTKPKTPMSIAPPELTDHSALAGLGLTSGVPLLEATSTKDDEDDEDELFQLPLSPRSPDMATSPFTEFRSDTVTAGFQGKGVL